MNVRQMLWNAQMGWVTTSSSGEIPSPSLVLYFAAPEPMRDFHAIEELLAMYPGVPAVGCSTGGEISRDECYEDSIVAVAIGFERARCGIVSVERREGEDGNDAGKRLAETLAKDPPRALFVLSDGTEIQGGDLVRGLRKGLSPDIIITGGLAGDDDRFQSTLVGIGRDLTRGRIAGVGFWGDELRIGHGCAGGWEPFGPKRVVTRSEGHILQEIDDEPALDFYCRYLGPEADHLPSNALRFPLRIQERNDDGAELLRTVISIDREKHSITLGGDIPTGQAVQLMYGKYERLIEGAAEAAILASQQGGTPLAIMVSCIGRKLLLGQRISEELEAAMDALGEVKGALGFYSYGEMSPFGPRKACEFHNQSMTITTIDEF